MKKIIGTLAIAMMIAVAMPTPSYAQYGGGGIIPPSVIRTGSRSGDRNRAPVVAPTAQIQEGQVLGEEGFRFEVNMTIGSTGNEVLELQKRLRTEGFFNVEPTGYFGPITQAAVKAYQSAHGVSDTGYVGPLTLAQLNSSIVSATVDTPQVASLKAQVVGLIQQAIGLLQAQLASVISAASR